MASAFILEDGRVISSSGIENPTLSFLYGYLVGFTSGGRVFKHFYKKDFRSDDDTLERNGISSGYYDEAQFLSYLTSYNPVNYVTSTNITRYASFSKAADSDIISVDLLQATSQIVGGVEEFAPIYGKYSCSVEAFNNFNINGSRLFSDSWLSSTASLGFNDYINDFYVINGISIYDLTSHDEKLEATKLLATCCIIIKKIDDDLFSMFSNEFNNLLEAQKLYWQNTSFVDDEDILESFKKYSNFLFNFYSTIYRNKKFIESKEGTDKLFWLFSLLSKECLSIIDVSVKLKVLEYLVKNVTIGTIFASIDYEELVLKVLNSITLSQTTEFLEGLTNANKYNSYCYPLVVAFYSKIDDKFLGWFGEDNFKQFNFTLYQIWRESSYNPYQNDTFNESNLNQFTYNRKMGTSPDLANPIYQALGFHYNELDYTASPIVLNFVSDNFFGIFFDNFDFYFSDGKDRDTFKYDLRQYKNCDEAPTGKILAVQEKYTDSGDIGLYGTYDYLQPVSLIDSSIEGIYKVPVVNGEGLTELDGESQAINTLVPVFFLKFIADSGDVSNIYKSIGYFIDVVSILAGGYGVVAKFRYLRSLSGFTEAIMAGSEVGTAQVVTLYAATAAEAISFTSGTLSFLVKLTQPYNGNKSWYKKLVTVLTWVEICSGAGSILSERLLKRSTKKLVDDFNSNGWPEEFLNDERGYEARQTLQQVSGVAVNVSINFLQKWKTEINSELPKSITQQCEKYLNRGRIDDSAINEITEILPRFSQKKYQVIEGNKAKNLGTPLHLQTEIDEMIEFGFNLELPKDVVKGLILKSFRTLKQANKEAVKDWMTNYANFLEPILQGGRGKVPYIFNDLIHFNDFTVDFKQRIFDKFRLDILDTDVGITGSALTKPVVPDLDLAMYPTGNNIQKLMKHYKNISNQAFDETAAKKFINGMENYYKKQGRIYSSYIIAIDPSTNRVISLKNELRKLGIDKISSKKIDFNIYDVTDAGRNIPPIHYIKF